MGFRGEQCLRLSSRGCRLREQHMPTKEPRAPPFCWWVPGPGAGAVHFGLITALAEPQTKERKCQQAVPIAGQQLRSFLHRAWPEGLRKSPAGEGIATPWVRGRTGQPGRAGQAGCAWGRRGTSGRGQGLEGHVPLTPLRDSLYNSNRSRTPLFWDPGLEAVFLGTASDLGSRAGGLPAGRPSQRHPLGSGP